jgi:hypothetical protein
MERRPEGAVAHERRIRRTEVRPTELLNRRRHLLPCRCLHSCCGSEQTSIVRRGVTGLKAGCLGFEQCVALEHERRRNQNRHGMVLVVPDRTITDPRLMRRRHQPRKGGIRGRPRWTSRSETPGSYSLQGRTCTIRPRRLAHPVRARHAPAPSQDAGFDQFVNFGRAAPDQPACLRDSAGAPYRVRIALRIGARHSTFSLHLLARL